MIIQADKIAIKMIIKFNRGDIMIGEVIFVDKQKILVKLDIECIKADSNDLTRVVQLNVNEHSKMVKYKDRIEFEGIIAVSKYGKKKTTMCEPSHIAVIKKAIRTSILNNGSQKDQPKEMPTEAEKTNSTVRFSLSQDQSKFLIPAGKAGDYTKDQIIEKFGRLIHVSHIGKSFGFKKNQGPNSRKSIYKDGEQVCYVYYYKKEPVFSAEEFLQATRNYYEFIAYIKKTGVKPRHKASEITEIKKAKALCDSRLKIEGNSWIALNSEYLWYVTHKLSPITMDNNIKINNQFAQCWRISLHQISNKIEELEKIDLVLFKSSAIPNAHDDEVDEDVI